MMSKCMLFGCLSVTRIDIFLTIKTYYTWKTVKSMGKCKVFMGIAVVVSCIMFLYGLISGDTEYACG